MWTGSLPAGKGRVRSGDTNTVVGNEGNKNGAPYPRAAGSAPECLPGGVATRVNGTSVFIGNLKLFEETDGTDIPTE
ncbi:MAG: hypothetical protein WD361_10110, partial [Gracilimonas sp.]